MTGPEPPERDRSAGNDRDATDAAFAEIIAGWDAPAPPPDRPEPDEEPGPDATVTTARSALPSPEGPGDSGESGEPFPPAAVPVDDEEHYIPPEPPPIPVLAPRTFCGVLMILGGIVVMVFPDLLSLSGNAPLLLGLLAMAGGIGWLLMGLRDDSGPDDGWDDGARL